MRKYLIVFILLLLSRLIDAAVINLQGLELVPAEVNPFEVIMTCAANIKSLSCRELQSIAPTFKFQLVPDPRGLNDEDRKALATSRTPISEVIGPPISEKKAIQTDGNEFCTNRIFIRAVTDQYGGHWEMIPYMFKRKENWNYQWTVLPKFAGYKVEVNRGKTTVSVLQTQNDLLQASSPIQALINRLTDAFALKLFER